MLLFRWQNYDMLNGKKMLWSNHNRYKNTLLPISQQERTHTMDYAKESLKKHAEWKGKIEVNATVPVKTKEDLSLAYTPGVAEACLAIEKDIDLSYTLTRRHNSTLR